MMQNLSQTIGPDQRGRIRLNVSTALTQFAVAKPLCDTYKLPICTGAASQRISRSARPLPFFQQFTLQLVGIVRALAGRYIRPVSGGDVLRGLAGDDTLAGLGGGDTIDGGDGFDTADYSDAASGVTASLATGRGTAGDAAGDTLSGIERLVGSAFADQLTGSSQADTLSETMEFFKLIIQSVFYT